MSTFKDALPGKFIVIDGPDGAGKTTQLKLLGEWLRGEGASVVETLDPGGTEIGEAIRRLLLERGSEGMGPQCEAMLFMASRAQLVHEVIRPARARGDVVLCDRFVSATVAYQGASGVPAEEIIAVARVAVQGCWPDLTVIVDLPAEAGMRRIGVVSERQKKNAPGVRQPPLFGDRFEARDGRYHQQVRRNFLSLAGHYPAPVVVVDAAGSVEEVHSRLRQAVRRWACDRNEKGGRGANST
jgi:dTMP kinase